MECATFKELVGLFALNALDPEERARAEEHLASGAHDGCLEVLAVAMQGASVLDGDGPVEAPAPRVWEAIARQVAPSAARLRRAKRLTQSAWAFAALAVVIVGYVLYRPPGQVALVAAVETARREGADKAAALTATTRERDACQRQLQQDKLRGEAVALLRLAGTQLFPLPAEKGHAATANAILHTGVKRAYVVADGLRPVADHDYELWVARGKKVVAAGLVHVDAEGTTVLRVDYESLLGGTPDAMMITLEPAGGGDTVRGPTIVIGTLHG